MRGLGSVNSRFIPVAVEWVALGSLFHLGSGVGTLGRALGLRYSLDCVIHICMLKSQPAVPQNALCLEMEVFEEAIKLAQSH